MAYRQVDWGSRTNVSTTAGRLSPLPPQLDLPLDLDLFAAVALPGVWARLLACLVLVGWFVLGLFLGPVLVGALWLSLRSVG